MRTRSLKVIDMAVHKVAIITPEKSIRESARQMRVEHVGSLVVVDQDGKPIGMLTDRDITIEGVARGVDVDQTTVRDLMTAPVVTATETLHTPTIDKIEVVRKGKVRRAKLNYIRSRVGKAAKVKELVK